MDGSKSESFVFSFARKVAGYDYSSSTIVLDHSQDCVASAGPSLLSLLEDFSEKLIGLDCEYCWQVFGV